MKVRRMEADELSPDMRQALRALCTVLRFETGTDEMSAQITIESYRTEGITFSVDVRSEM